ncbi:MAG: 2-hydroxychromene-2-carboxylate isomerase [Arenicellales bacterium]|nr:2-hydroxychromene-2-carboxylate isomerase [Arenicellales bacterium]
MLKNIDFWFSIGSTYTYLTVMRLKTLEQEKGIRFNWQPFSVRKLMQEIGNIPFTGKPVKEKYMWRDIERRAQRYGIPITVPVEYPLKNFDLANRVAIVARQEGWCDKYTRTAYRLWFVNGLPPGDDPNLSESLESAGQSIDRIFELATSDSITDAYHDATSQARSLGIFGSPSFVVDGHELFWGDDRLEDAIDYVQSF